MTQIPNAQVEYTDDYAIADIMGEKIYLPIDDKGISLELIEYGIHESECLPAWLSIVKKGSIVIEVGANLGYYTVLTCRNLNNTGHVYSIEPVKESCDALYKTIKANGYTNAEVFQLAIADYDGDLYLDVCDGSNLSSAIRTLQHTASGFAHGNMLNWVKHGIDVECMTLDTFADAYSIDKVDILRMDIEGFETSAVKGAHHMLENLMGPGSCFFLEVHPVMHREPHTEYKDMIDYIISLGFTPYRDVRWQGRLVERNKHAVKWHIPDLYADGGFGYVFFIKDRV